jgi:hypothetical protein
MIILCPSNDSPWAANRKKDSLYQYWKFLYQPKERLVRQKEKLSIGGHDPGAKPLLYSFGQGKAKTEIPDTVLSNAAISDTAETGVLELAVVIPTYNEESNIAGIVERLERVLAGISHEIIFVDDDSPDGTWEAVRVIALNRRNVRVI